MSKVTSPLKVSVIICVYNGERFLAEAIQSVRDQDFENIQLVVVNDGSTDKTEDIINSFDNLTLVSHKTNQGHPGAKNSGLAVAEGEFICFLDADDRWSNQKISIQLAFHQENPEILFSFTAETFCFENGAEAPNWTRKQAFQSDHIAYCSGSMMFHKAAFKIVGEFNPSYRNGDATDWIFRAKDHGLYSGEINQVLLYRRIHGNNLSNRVGEENKTLFAVLKSSIDRQKIAK